MTSANSRTSDHEIDVQFLNRWSPRALTGEEISQAELDIILEGARWAPSSYNSQPWRFIYGRKGTPAWDKLFGLLNAYNQSWAKNASALLILVSSKTMLPPGAKEPVPSHSHSLDAGAAWSYLALQASLSGWAAHAMVGFDIEGSAAALGVPEGYRVEIAIAIGKLGDKSMLPEAMQAREAPNGRLPLAEIAFEGSFKG